MSNNESNLNRYQFSLPLLHPRNWLTWFGLALFFFVTLLPMPVIDWLGGRLGVFAANKNKKRLNIVKTNLSLCFPQKTLAEIDVMARLHFQSQFRSLLHYSILWWRPAFIVRKKISVSGFENISRYRQQGKKIIVLLTHNVGLEFAVAAISMDYKVNGPFKPMKNPVINWMVARGRMRFGKVHGIKLFTRDDGLRPLIRETRDDKLLIYLADEDLGRKNSVFVPFYGVTKATIPVLGRLAKSCNAVVLPCVSCYEEKSRSYSIKLLEKIEDFPVGDDLQDSIKMNKAIEQVVDHCPVQYLWTLRYFQTRPPGESSVYE